MIIFLIAVTVILSAACVWLTTLLHKEKQAYNKENNAYQHLALIRENQRINNLMKFEDSRDDRL